MNNKIFELDSDQKSQVISSVTENNTLLKEENEKLAKRLRRQKRLKWLFGGIGFVGGVLVVLL